MTLLSYLMHHVVQYHLYHSSLILVLYAHDSLLVSDSPEGLHNCMNKVYKYCENWGLEINYDKSKILYKPQKY